MLVPAAHGLGWGVVALHPEQAVVEQSLTDGNWPGWVRDLPGPSTVPAAGLMCVPGASQGRASRTVTHGQGTAQGAADLTVKAFSSQFQLLRSVPFPVIYGAR